MRKSTLIQVSLLLSGFLLVLYLFNQPKFIVEDQTEIAFAPATNKQPTSTASISSEEHNSNEVDTQRIEELTTMLINSDNSEKKAIFADSIAQTYRNAMLFDSSAKYFELVAELGDNLISSKVAAIGVFEAFQNSMNPERRKELGKKAIGFLDKVLNEDPTDVEIQIKKAVALVYTEPMPMGGIQLLKDIIQEHPSNTEARLYLGEFRFTVGKVDEAIEQFLIVHDLDPTDFKALLYLADGYLSLGQKAKAEKYINEIRSLNSTDPYIESVLKQFDQELKKL